MALVARASVADCVCTISALHRACRELPKRRCALSNCAHIPWNVVDDPVNESEWSIRIIHNDSEALCARRRSRERECGGQFFVSAGNSQRHLLAADEARTLNGQRSSRLFAGDIHRSTLTKAKQEKQASAQSNNSGGHSNRN
jgi:hypothetical protein